MDISGILTVTRGRRAVAAAALALVASGAPARAVAASGDLPTDPVLARLIDESLEARPEIRRAERTVEADRERIPQAGALPDPVLSLGIQNDGFDGIQVGKMETSFYQVMITQALPWPGKRGLRTDVARLAAEQSDASVKRLVLSTEADVRRAYLDLSLTRERLRLLDRLEVLWKKSLGIAKTRYEAGEGAQSDVLRAQLELNRLRQRRWTLQADERTRLQILNRLRAHPLDEPIETPTRVADLGTPPVAQLDAAVADAAARSPEVQAAHVATQRADAQLRLSKRDRFPDLSVNAGIMPRGSLDPMWQAGISISLPVWSHRKQSRAVAESRARAGAEEQGAEAVEQVLRLRVAERLSALASLKDTIDLYRSGLLVQSQATADSTLAQYQVGRVTFASVLDANAGYVNDEEGYLIAIADAHRIAIAQAEVSLDPVGVSAAGGGLNGAAMPGTGSVGGSSQPMTSGGAAAAPPPGAAASSSGASSSMSSGM